MKPAPRLSRRPSRLALPPLVILVALLAAACGGGLEGSTPDERAVSATELGIVGNEEAIPVLVEAVENEPELVQNAAITSLGRVGTVEAVRALERFSDHESRVLRTGVAQALSDVLPESYPEAAAVLVEMGEASLPRGGPGDDPFLRLRRAVMTSLAVTGQPVAVPFLVDRLERDYDEQVRNVAVQALGSIGSAHVIEAVGKDEMLRVLEEVYRTDNEKNRAWAIESIGMLDDERAVPVVMEAFEDIDHITRGKAARALANLEGEEAIPVLEDQLVQETNDMTAVVLAHALATLGETKDTVPFLEDRVINAGNPFARAEAAKVLREVGRRESMVALDQAFENDRDGLVKKEAADSIRILRVKFPREEAEPAAE